MKITLDLNQSVTTIMTAQPLSVNPDTSMVDIAALFESHLFHHVPVLDNDKNAVGIISKNDFHQLQHHFTRLGDEHAQRSNLKIFKTLLASDVMSTPPVCLDHSATIGDALEILMGNKKHSILITRDNVCEGIVTAHDYLQLVTSLSPSLND